MKRFIVSVLCVSVFFIGLGSLIEKASASLKSDEKALELINKARRAIGGDSAIGGVKSMTIQGKVAKTFDLNGVARTENGDLEISFELPNRLSRKIKIGSGEGAELVDKQVDVMVVRKGDGDNLQFKTENPDGVRKFTITGKDGTTEEITIDGRSPLILRKSDGETIVSDDGKTANLDGKKVFFKTVDSAGGFDLPRSNELFRTTFSLLLTSPEGLDVSYTYVGEGSVDGAACEIIAANDGGSTIKLYLDKSTSLPRMMTYEGHKPLIFKINKEDAQPNDNGDMKVFSRTKLPEPEKAEFQIKFHDFRSVGGLQLPHRWTQTIGGKDDEVIDITSYELNPANIAEKFNEQPRIFLRKKADQ